MTDSKSNQSWVQKNFFVPRFRFVFLLPDRPTAQQQMMTHSTNMWGVKNTIGPLTSSKQYGFDAKGSYPPKVFMTTEYVKVENRHQRL